ncbi:cation diffusion facilitator family transporter [Neomegalonema sp.]|uniref:cation diffusion facilitator family transporter n=1 Tax=Neomegalonema sp. TaxID=2039713 RepID=UPI002605A260|nr:cation diffusion facilitator family transporter [Neomegalonema sp.]MDD2867916.1 cation diffusion facilitator family transporter [Neomegalonema sp.]
MPESVNSPNPAPTDVRHGRLVRIAGAVSVGVALGLTALKAWAWIRTDSLGVAASLADSALDVVSSGANFAAILYAQRPPDEDHRFGHASAEDLAALAQSALILISAVLIGGRSIQRLLEPAPLQAAPEGLAAMVLAILVTGALVLFQRQVVKKTGSLVVAADSLHYVSDLLPALGAILALGIIGLGGPGWVDPAVGLLAAGILLRSVWGVGGEALSGLMDRELPEEDLERVKALCAGDPVLRGWHDLKTRRSGGRRFIQIHIELDGALSLHDAHERARSLKAAILRIWPDADVIVHMDPAEAAPAVS